MLGLPKDEDITFSISVQTNNDQYREMTNLPDNIYDIIHGFVSCVNFDQECDYCNFDQCIFSCGEKQIKNNYVSPDTEEGTLVENMTTDAIKDINNG